MNTHCTTPPCGYWSRFHRPHPMAWLCFLAAFFTLIALGIWQLERLSWKEALIAEIEAAKTAPPLTALPDTASVKASASVFRRIAITGTFAKQEFHVTPRYYHEKLGYHLFVPFTLRDGRHVLVNRGWVPTAQKDPATRPKSLTPHGKVTLTVMLRDEPARHYFTPPNQPEKNLWFGRDVEGMARVAGITDIYPYSLDIVGVQQADILPIPSDGNIPLLNDHLHYAITWFLLAIGALVVFMVFHRKGSSNSSKKAI
jgi:surfeit locus 1 family protein